MITSETYPEFVAQTVTLIAASGIAKTKRRLEEERPTFEMLYVLFYTFMNVEILFLSLLLCA